MTYQRRRKLSEPSISIPAREPCVHPHRGCVGFTRPKRPNPLNQVAASLRALDTRLPPSSHTPPIRLQVRPNPALRRQMNGLGLVFFPFATRYTTKSPDKPVRRGELPNPKPLATNPVRCRANPAYIRESGPDFGPGSQMKVLKPFGVIPSLLEKTINMASEIRRNWDDSSQAPLWSCPAT